MDSAEVAGDAACVLVHDVTDVHVPDDGVRARMEDLVRVAETLERTVLPNASLLF